MFMMLSCRADNLLIVRSGQIKPLINVKPKQAVTGLPGHREVFPNYCVGLPWELLYADDLCLIADSEKKSVKKIKCWKDAMKTKGLRINMNKTKVMCCKVRTGQVENSAKWPCAVCKTGVGENSIICSACKKWVHKRCSGLIGSLKVAAFSCKRCVDGGEQKDIKKEIEIDCEGKVEKFCYLGDKICLRYANSALERRNLEIEVQTVKRKENFSKPTI
ncbi:hypothetical protein HELRODRAFT_163018 [Helobdella robusta]|uniref:Zinc finger PHD-type domain-containing protein n=1 Tax=Helobdella robusta TaxID=6412 RepID=T1ETK6_HELRO|nr:hypothetical protein HELRODRAFT_163018 [Helobdella robusta]ESN99468.1 hypothetical protein HELRODRAFT_163018 [Helobdella robusta]